MSMAKERERRYNAGSKMARLLNEEEDGGDEFYNNLYGGMHDEDVDNDYEQESSEEDKVDSDFDIDENDANAQQQENADTEGGTSAVTKDGDNMQNRRPRGSNKEIVEDDDEKAAKKSNRKKYRIYTKAYKEPVRGRPRKVIPSRDVMDPSYEKSSPVSHGKSPLITPVTRTQRAASMKSGSNSGPTSPFKRPIGISGPLKRGRIPNAAMTQESPQVRRLTQEELLEEAKITEQINLRSLAQYQRLEIEKKRVRSFKSQPRGPFIRFHSLAVPVIPMNPTTSIEFSGEQGSPHLATLDIDTCEMNERTFVTFPNDSIFHESFASSATCNIPRTPSSSANATSRRHRVCPITGKSARYFCPVTKVPYADMAAFRVLRHLYQLHLETGEKPISLVRKFRNGQVTVPGVQLPAATTTTTTTASRDLPIHPPPPLPPPAPVV